MTPRFSGGRPRLPGIRRLRRELTGAGADVVELLARYRRPEYARAWRRSPAWYALFGRRLIEEAQPNRAYDLLREAFADFPEGEQHELCYLRALALARGGNDRKAEEYTQELLRRAGLGDRLRVETLSLLARIRKDRYQRAVDPLQRRRLARESARDYTRAWALDRDPFPGINAATMQLLAGSRRRARELAAEVLEVTGARLAGGGGAKDLWAMATRGEARLLLGDGEGAEADYRRALALAGSRLGTIASMRRNVLLIHEVLGVSEELLALFELGRVVAFSGHMVDPPGAPKGPDGRPRYPDDPAFERRLRGAIRRELVALDARVGITSAARGADILFAEEVLRRGGELRIVLPFEREDFLETSVDLGLPELSAWRRRYRKVLDGAIQVHQATRERSRDDPALFAFTNRFLQGLARMRAAQLGTAPVALVAMDGTSKAVAGGAGDFLAGWRAGGAEEARVIDLRELRGDRPWSHSGAPRRRAKEADVRVRARARRTKALLFGDVKGYSKLTEEQAPSFFVDFLDHVARVIRAAPVAPAFANTWGDGLFLVYDEVPDCAEVATRLIEMMERTDWVRLGLPPDLTVRLGLHAGPVFTRKDPILTRPNFFGSNVNRAARLEPITAPGCAYTTEPFAALVASEAPERFHCEYVGIETYAKDFETAPIYRLVRR